MSTIDRANSTPTPPLLPDRRDGSANATSHSVQDDGLSDLVGQCCTHADGIVAANSQRIPDPCPGDASLPELATPDAARAGQQDETVRDSGCGEAIPKDPARTVVQDRINRVVVALANATGDMRQLDAIDGFRAERPPAEQTHYDAQLERLRQNGGIALVDSLGHPINNPALRDMALRGTLATAFVPTRNSASGLFVLLEQTLDRAADGNHRIRIIAYPNVVPIADFYAPPAAGEAETSGVLATPNGDIAFGLGSFYNALAAGENLFDAAFFRPATRS